MFNFRLTKLERLDLSDNVVGVQVIEQLVNLMRSGRLSHLKTLKIQRTSISDKAITILLAYQREAWLQKNRLIALGKADQFSGCLLEDLDLSENGLKNVSLMELAETLKVGVPLKNVSLRDNRLSSYFRYAFEDDWVTDAQGTFNIVHETYLRPVVG